MTITLQESELIVQDGTDWPQESLDIISRVSGTELQIYGYYSPDQYVLYNLDDAPDLSPNTVFFIQSALCDDQKIQGRFVLSWDQVKRLDNDRPDRLEALVKAHVEAVRKDLMEFVEQEESDATPNKTT